MNNIARRIKQARRVRYDTATKAAEKIGLNPNTYRSIEKGTRAPSRDMIVAIAKAYSVSIEWLLTGQGDPDNAAIPGETRIAFTLNLSLPLSPEEADILIMLADTMRGDR